MGDVLPNYKVSQMRLKTQILAQQHNIAKQELEIMEMGDRVDRYEQNIVAAEKTIVGYETDLRGLEKEHGKLSKADLEAAKEKIKEG